MRTTKRTLRMVLFVLAVILTATLAAPATAEASGGRKIKSVSVKVSGKKVTKKTYTLSKGKKAVLKVSVNPSKAKKSVTYKSSNKKIATVSKKGKITAKKKGTAKITITVRGKNGKKKTTWIKVKVTSKSGSGHKHTYKTQAVSQKKVKIVDCPAWDEDVYEKKYVCKKCGFYTELEAEIISHVSFECKCGYSYIPVKVDTIHHDEVFHYVTKTTYEDRCTDCGKVGGTWTRQN